MRTPHWQTLLALAILLLPPAAWGSPSLTITGPAAGNLTDTRPTFTITYSSDNPNLPLNLSTFSVTANGVAWTGRFTAAPDGATYIVPQGDPLVAGPLVLTASIRDTAGTQASDGRIYAVVPTFVAMLPTTGEPGDTLTLTVRGLSATPTDNSAVFASLSGSAIVVPFASADVPADMGSVLVPEDAASGDVFVRIAAGTAQTDTPQTIAFTRRGLGPTCGTGTRQLQYLPNGDFIVYYSNYHSWNLVDPRCPPEANQATKAIRYRRDLDWAFTLAESTYENGRYIDVVGLTSDSYGNPAVLLHSWNTPGSNITRLKYNNRLHEFVAQVYDLFAAGNGQHVPIAFDPSGNLYLLGRRENPGGIRLYKVPKQQLTSIGSLQPAAITDDLSLDALDEPADIAMSCDGTAFVGLRSSCLAGSNWTRVRHLDLATGTELGTLNEPGLGCLRDLEITCRTNELLGASFSTSDTTVRTRFWRALVDPDGGLGVPTTISENTSSPDHPLGYLSVTPAGRIATPHENPATYGGGPYSGLVYIQPTVAPCQFVSAPPTAQGLSCPLCELTVLPTTDRWKPQRSNEKISIRFEGPRDLATGPEYPATLEITPWGTQAPLTGVIRPGTAPCEPTDVRCQYEVDWDGGWVQDNERLPAGNYSIVVKAKAGTALRDVQSQAYRKVSLVEVKSVRFEPGAQGQTFGPQPEVSPVEGQDPRLYIPATGMRVFAEVASPPIPGEELGPILDEVRVLVETSPRIPDDPAIPNGDEEVTVYLRSFDVDDPAPMKPPDRDGPDNSGTNADNRGTPSAGTLLDASLSIPPGTETAETRLKVSHNPGDNFRVAASTWGTWLAGLRAPNTPWTGPLTIWGPLAETLPNGEPNYLDEGTAGPASPMLTVWRSLHLEVDETQIPEEPAAGTPAYEQRNFIRGAVKSMLTGQSPTGLPQWYVEVQAETTSPPLGLRDSSDDLGPDPPASGMPFGRFEGGSLLLGSEAAQGQSLKLMGNGVSNGVEYVWTDVPATELTIEYQVTSGTLRRRTGHLVSWSADTSTFQLEPPLPASPSYVGGTLTIAGVSWGISAIDGSYVTIDGGNFPFKVIDDDRGSGAPNLVDERLLADADYPSLNPLVHAYIRPRKDLPNQSPAEVRRNTGRRDVDWDLAAREALLTGRETTTQSTDGLWVGYLQGAFQGAETGDGDPWLNEESVSGIAPGLCDQWGALVYDEMLWGENASPADAKATAIHELGHEFGLTHACGGLMAQGAPDVLFFTPESLAWIRRRQGTVECFPGLPVPYPIECPSEGF